MDKVYIKSIVQNVLNTEFKSIERKKIHEYSDRLNFCCFYCGDGKSDHKKRGNLYFNKLLYICFNCGKKTNFDRMSKDFNQQLDPQKKLEIIQHLDSIISYKDYEEDILETSLEQLIDMTDIERIFSEGDFAITDFKPLEKDGLVYNYLSSRGITSEYHKDIYQAKYWYNEGRYENVMCFLNRNGDKVLGIQIRNLKEGKKRMFKIYNFETLYKWSHGVEDITDIDINQIVIYNKISYYFNILKVSFESRITIFEGYLDSLFYPNSVGVVGVNTDFRFLENNNLEIQYFFDNDTAGFDKSEEKIRTGHSVFLWKKLFEDIVKKKPNEDPYKLLYRISKIKDLNKLSELISGAFKKLELWEYFSKDEMDIKYIPKKEKKYYKKLAQ
jgi:hypothetical protein